MRRHFHLCYLAVPWLISAYSVCRDIIHSLGMSEDNLFQAIHGFNRENIYYEVCSAGVLILP